MAADRSVSDPLSTSGPSAEQEEGAQPLPEAAAGEKAPDGSSTAAVTPTAPIEDTQPSEPKSPAVTTLAKSAARPPGAKVLLPFLLPSLESRFAAAAGTFASLPTEDDLVLSTAAESPRAGASGRASDSSSFIAASATDADPPPTGDGDMASEPTPVPALDPVSAPRAIAPPLPDRIPEQLTLLGVPVVGALPLDLAGVEYLAREALGAAGFELPRDEAGSDTYAWVAVAGLLTGGAAYWAFRRPRPRTLVWGRLGPDSFLTDWGDGDGTRDR